MSFTYIAGLKDCDEMEPGKEYCVLDSDSGRIVDVVHICDYDDKGFCKCCGAVQYHSVAWYDLY